MKQSYIVVILLLILTAGGAFFGGVKYQQRKLSKTFSQFGRTQGARSLTGQGRSQIFGLRPVTGEIINADDKSITVKLTDGSSKIIVFTEKTAINKASEATKEDLKAGEKVMVYGLENSDGSVTAQTIQLNPLTPNILGK